MVYYLLLKDSNILFYFTSFICGLFSFQQDSLKFISRRIKDVSFCFFLFIVLLCRWGLCGWFGRSLPWQVFRVFGRGLSLVCTITDWYRFLAIFKKSSWFKSCGQTWKVWESRFLIPNKVFPKANWTHNLHKQATLLLFGNFT